MGNSESSSSQFPTRNPYGNGDGDGDGRNRNKKAADDDNTFLKISAAVTGTALLAVGAWHLATSSPSDKRDDGEDRTVITLESGRSSESRRSGGRTPYLESIRNTKQYTLPRMIKIMSYNVWSGDTEIHARMESISILILKHSPDVVFFQEITPEIYKIFRSFKWWKSYNCSISPDEAETKKYFPMLLPAEFLDRKQFTKAIGKEIIIAKVGLGLPKDLFVASIHLKSPEYPEMHREERTAQAEKAIAHLDSATNIVFGGDMNWDDESDGRFPLLDGWVDAWTELKGDSGEDGWTFDTIANPMLKGRKPLLQKRLDRFMCKLRDFSLVSVEMIGLDPIPDLYAVNKYGKMAPVLPSDHFGLLLTICLN
ncbi:uncharacterized protein [Typha angustifolia]|uniref:uncharacterized protein isoform X2 n=1 Tax=Typha angustifolia TaxID=59011 RepID=UPI003C2E3E9C